MERSSKPRRNRKSKPPYSSYPPDPAPPPPPPAPTKETISIPADEAAQLRSHAENWHERTTDIAGKRIEALEEALGLSKTRDGKTKTGSKKTGSPDQQRRDERQLTCWKAAQSVLGELEPDESLADALEMLYLGPLINQIRQLDTFNGTQTRLEQLREKCQKKRYELKRVEMELQEIENTLEQKDEEMRGRFWRCLRYYRAHFSKFDD
ncbi:hypothetical protein ACEPAF_2910 [Sanghuangporus sanghuang]